MSTPAPQLSIADMLALVDRLRPPAQEPPERGLAKNTTTVITAIGAALAIWVGSSINTLNSSVSSMLTSITAMQKTMGDVQAVQGGSQLQMGDLKAGIARIDARADAQEADLTRVKERVRILEGQKPLNPRPLTPEPF